MNQVHLSVAKCIDRLLDALVETGETEESFFNAADRSLEPIDIALENLANQSGCSVLTALRNSIAYAPIDLLPLFKVYVRWLVSKNGASDTLALKKIADSLPQIHGPSSFLNSLAVRRQAPTQDLTFRALAADPWALLKAFRVYGFGISESEWHQATLHILQAFASKKSVLSPPDLHRLCQEWIKAPGRGLNLEEIRGLSQDVTDRLMLLNEISAPLLDLNDPALHQEIQKSKVRTWERHDKEDLLADLSDLRLNTERIHRLLLGVSKGWLEPGLIKSGLGTIRVPWDARKVDAKTRKIIAEMPASHERVALDFAAAKDNQLNGTLEKLSGTEMAELCDIFGTERILERLATARADGESAVKLAMVAGTGRPHLVDEVGRLLSKKRFPNSSRAAIASGLILSLRPSKRRDVLRTKPAFLRSICSQGTLSPSIAEPVLKAFEGLQSSEKLISEYGPRFVANLCLKSGDVGFSWLATTVEKARNRRRFSRLAPVLARLKTKILKVVLGETLEVDEFLRLLDLTPMREMRTRTPLLKLKTRTGINVAEGAAAMYPVPRRLEYLLKTAAPEVRERYADRHLEFVRTKRPEVLNLERALRNRDGSALEGIPQSIREAHLPWIRERWHDQPTLAVAFEAAVALSPRDISLLVFLAHERWRNLNPDLPGRSFDHLYHSYKLPKRRGGNRTITAPPPNLKRLQRRLLDTWQPQTNLHSAAHGFRPGHSIVSNASPHVGHDVVVTMDIADFFPSTQWYLILAACKRLVPATMSLGAACFIADICSWGGGLPQGAPTSPFLANLILTPADASLATAAKKKGVTYTRYADDLAVSGGDAAVAMIPFVRDVLNDFGYRIDPKKTNIFRRGRRQVVTGLVVNEKPNVPRRIRRRIRAAVNRAASGGQPEWHGSAITTRQLGGLIGHLAMTQPEEARGLLLQLKDSKVASP